MAPRRTPPTKRRGPGLTSPPAPDATESELRERVKELSCLYQVAAAFVEHRSSLRACFRQIAAILPTACRFPDAAEACVRLDETEEQTPGFDRVVHRLSSPVAVAGHPRGSVTIGYREADIPDAAEGRFLAEERSLLDTVARQIGVFVESVEAEQRRAGMESQLRHADRLATIGQLAAGVAHELNEPLSSALGFAQLALKSPDLPPQVRADLDKIVRASLHGREIVRKLLLFARQAPASKQPISINSIVEDAMFLLEAGCEHPGVRFVLDLAPDLPQLEADPVQVRQVLMNLVINAIHAIPDRGVITVRTGLDGAYVTLTVEDTGAGMTPEVAKHIFDPFFTTKDVGQGTGLGLSVVQGIVAGHGGMIDLHTAPGAGTRFCVRLPVRSPAPPPASPDAP